MLKKNLKLKWTSIDSASVKAPKGGSDTGANPTDRGKLGSKRHILTDGEGTPISVKITGANVHDKWLAKSVLSITKKYAKLCGGKIVHLCLDKGYDYKDTEADIKRRNVIPHIRRRGEPPLLGIFKGKARRWVVERTNSWHNRYRSLLIRWEMKSENYLALVQFACVFIIYNKLIQ